MTDTDYRTDYRYITNYNVNSFWKMWQMFMKMAKQIIKFVLTLYMYTMYIGHKMNIIVSIEDT